MRHGEAEPFAASDQDRALSPRGVKETRQLAAWLGQAVPDIGLVCHSPYLRARQTADQVCHILGSPNRLTLISLVPSAESTAVLSAAMVLSAAIMVVSADISIVESAS